MKKRLLSALLACALLATTSAAAVDVVIPSASGGTTTVTVDTENDPLLELFVEEMTPAQLADFLAAQDPEEPAASALALEDISAMVRQNNLTILANDQIIPGKKAVIDDAIDEIEDGIDDIEDAIDQLEDAIDGLEAMDKMYDSLIDLYGGAAGVSGSDMEELVYALFGFGMAGDTEGMSLGGVALLLMSDQTSIASQIAQLEAQIDTLEDQIDELKDQRDELEDTDFDAAERQLDSVVDQIVKGAETLYIALHTMQSSYDGLLRQETILQMKLTELEKRYELGQVSAVDVASVRDGMRELTRGKETLEMNIRNSKGDLNLLLGRDADVNFELVALPEVSSAQITAMNLEGDLKRGMKNSYDIFAAEEAIDTAKDGDGADRKYNIRQAEYQLQSAENSFRQSFTKLFRAVEDAARAVQAASDSRGFKITELNVAKTKYGLGKISYNDYVEAQINLAQADADLKTAKNDLYLAYNNYQWAIRGVVA